MSQYIAIVERSGSRSAWLHISPAAGRWLFLLLVRDFRFFNRHDIGVSSRVNIVVGCIRVITLGLALGLAVCYMGRGAE